MLKKKGKVMLKVSWSIALLCGKILLSVRSFEFAKLEMEIEWPNGDTKELCSKAYILAFSQN